MVSSDFVLHNIPSAGDLVPWLTMIFGAVAAALGLRVRASKAGADVKRHAAEGSLYERLIKERDDALRDAREAWSQRTHDAERIATLVAREESLEREVIRLRVEFEALRRHIRRRFPDAVDFLPSGPSELHEPPR